MTKLRFEPPIAEGVASIGEQRQPPFGMDQPVDLRAGFNDVFAAEHPAVCIAWSERLVIETANAVITTGKKSQ